VLVVGKMMAGDWGWRKERYPLHAMPGVPDRDTSLDFLDDMMLGR
jgi:hypothetical protein